MADRLTKEQRHKNMSAIRGKNVSIRRNAPFTL